MIVEQRDIVFLNFQIPNQGFKPHLCLVISNNEIHESEKFFIALMLTSANTNDIFSYWLKNNMLINQLDKKTQIRLHLFGVFENSIIDKKVSRMKRQAFEDLLDKIFEKVLTTDSII